MKRDYLLEHVVTGQGGEGFKLQESRFTLHITKEEILYCDSSESLGQVAQRNFVWPSLEVFKL